MWEGDSPSKNRVSDRNGLLLCVCKCTCVLYEIGLKFHSFHGLTVKILVL